MLYLNLAKVSKLAGTSSRLKHVLATGNAPVQSADWPALGGGADTDGVPRTQTQYCVPGGGTATCKQTNFDVKR